MKIVVIGYTAYIRTETVERLRGQGHDVVAASPKRRSGSMTVAPREPGHAGRPLRALLENIASTLHRAWLRRRRWRGWPRNGLAAREIPAPPAAFNGAALSNGDAASRR